MLLGPADGTAPTLENESSSLELLGYTVSGGGTRVDSITCRLNLAKARLRLQDTGGPIQYHRQIEIRRLDEDGKPTIVAAWGFVAEIGETIDRETESITVTARLDDFVFGKLLLTQTIWNHDEGANTSREVHWPIIFNPEIDGITEGNRSSKREDENDDPPGPYVFVSPESMRTDAAKQSAQGSDTASKWKLSEAVHRIIWSCNPDETYIKNPSLEEIQSTITGEHDIELKNVPLPFGNYLPGNLDALLRPNGFGWRLSHELEPEEGEDEATKRVTTIVFYRRGDGPKAKLLMQRVGKNYDLKKTNVEKYARSVELAELANRIVVRGGWKRYEGTFPLTPGWDDTHDSKVIGELSPDQDFGRDNPAVGRKYVIDCAGDYASPVRVSPGTPYDFADDLASTGTWAKVRRKLRPCLSQQADGDDRRSYGYFVEWWDRKAASASDPDVLADPGWTKVREPFQVLEHEAGIWFDEPPGRLWELLKEMTAEEPPAGVDHPGLHLRITCSVDADERMQAVATRTAESANGEEITLYVDMPDAWHYRQRKSTSALAAIAADVDDADDQEAMQDYADQVRDLEQAADVSCSIVLPGIDHAEFEIGQLIEQVDGRNLTLTANNPNAETKRPLQIVGFNFTVGDSQRTELLVETFRKERAAL